MNTKIKQYYELKKQIEDLTKQKDLLAEEIKDFLATAPDNKVTEDNYVAKLQYKSLLKYNNEDAILKYLEENNLSDIYTSRKINSTKFNAELREGKKIYVDLKPYITENVSTALFVDKIDSVEDLISSDQK